MPVGDYSGETEEQGPGLHLAAVELERSDVNGTKVAAGLHDAYVFEQPVHTQRRAPVGCLTAPSCWTRPSR